MELQVFKLEIFDLFGETKLEEQLGKQFQSGAEGTMIFSFDGINKRSTTLSPSTIYSIKISIAKSSEILLDTKAIYRGYDYVVSSGISYNPDGSPVHNSDGEVVTEMIPRSNHMVFTEV